MNLVRELRARQFLGDSLKEEFAALATFEDSAPRGKWELGVPVNQLRIWSPRAPRKVDPEKRRAWEAQYLADNRDAIHARQKRWRQQNAERLHKKDRDYYLSHKRETAARHRRYYLKHKAEVLERQSRYYEAHKAQVRRAQQAWVEANRDRVRAIKRKSYHKRKRERDSR